MPVTSVSVAAASSRLASWDRLVSLQVGSERSAFLILGALLLTAFLFAATPASAQPASPNRAASSPKTALGATPVKPSFSRPTWAQLNVQQQTALRPLNEAWDPLSEAQKRKWLEVAKGYPSLAPEDQKKMHSRLVEWVAMSPQQRAAARLNFGKTQELSSKLSADEKKAKWESYQALSAEEKHRLAEKAPPRPIGAATALKPVAPQKLTAVSDPAAPRENRAPIKITPLQPVRTP